MKNYRAWIACLLFSILGFAVSGLQQPTVSGQENKDKKKPTKWEYKFEFLDSGSKDSEKYRKLGELGDEGWELSAVIPNGSANLLYFKRQK